MTSSNGIDHTHAPDLRSWVDSAVPGQSDFPIQNLPLGLFVRKDGKPQRRIGVRIGDMVLDLCRVKGAWLRWSPHVEAAIHDTTLNSLMALPASERRTLRRRISDLLRAGGEDEIGRRSAVEGALLPIALIEPCLPAAVGSFIDFYACINHAITAGTVLRRGEPASLLPTWHWMPLAYQGRASSVVVGGGSVLRPWGLSRPDRTRPPIFGPTRELDYEVELGAFIGPGCPAGDRLSIDDAQDHVAGFVLVNDWSARDFQTWEGGPLGPLQSKSFATSVSPWVVTAEAMAPFRAPAYRRPADAPELLPHLASVNDGEAGGLDVVVEAYIRTARMRDGGIPGQRISRANARELYWTFHQMATHLASNGSGLAPGDLLASGTISGDRDGSRGCLLETTHRGRAPIEVGGEPRSFLEDGDEVVLTARCERDGFVPIGFGDCSGTIIPAKGE